jgi:NADP-dependent alcohol dehydrogenase
MKNFDFHVPTKIIFGEGTVPRIGSEAKVYGKKLLLVYGRSSIKKSGLYDKVTASLKEAGLEIVEHPGVRPNPVLSHLHKGVEIAKKEKVDFILGVGGGSVIDESKGIAAGAVTDIDPWNFYIGKENIKGALPVLSILTIPATGTEMNNSSVVTNDETKEKVGFMNVNLYPKVSILDPTVTYTVGPDYTAYSAVDAISHLFEGYFTHTAGWLPIQDRIVEGLVKSIIESTEIILDNPEDYTGRATFMWCATLAWNGLAIAGIGDFAFPMHLLEHPLSGLYDIAHGAGLSITIPAWLTWMLDKDTGKIAQFAENVFDIKKGSQERKAKKGVAALKGWFDKIGSPTTLSAAGIPESDIEKITDLTVKLSEVWGMDNDYTREKIIELYRLCV